MYLSSTYRVPLPSHRFSLPRYISVSSCWCWMCANSGSSTMGYMVTLITRGTIAAWNAPGIVRMGCASGALLLEMRSASSMIVSAQSSRLRGGIISQ